MIIVQNNPGNFMDHLGMNPTRSKLRDIIRVGCIDNFEASFGELTQKGLKCKNSFGQRVWKKIQLTNEAIPGLAAPRALGDRNVK